MEKGHYVIGKQRNAEGYKLFLGKVSAISGSIVEGYVEKDCHIRDMRTLFEIPKKDIVCDLGPNPESGKVYNLSLSSLYTGKKIDHDYFGTIHFFYRPSKEVGSRLMKAFDRAASVLKKAGFVPPEDCIWEIHPKEAGGKWAGYYKPSNDPEKNPHRFSFKPESWDPNDYPYLIYHEFAHHIHRQFLLMPKVNAAWIKCFNTSIKAKTIKKEESQQLLDLLMEGEEFPSSFKSGLDEDQRLSYNWILANIKAYHAVSVKELDLLFEAGEKDEIKALWPARMIHKKELKPIVSPYATTNFRELLAESFAFYFSRKELPANIHKLVEKSIQMAKTQQLK